MPFYKNRKSEKETAKRTGKRDWRGTKNLKSRARSKFLFAQKKDNSTGKKGRVRPLFLSRHDERFDSSFLETITVTQEWRERREESSYIYNIIQYYDILYI